MHKISQTMNYVGHLAETVFVTVKELYKGLNPATLTGCIDIIVVRQPDGSFQCSPFHVRFGKLGVLRSKEKVVDIEINGEPVDLHMKLGDNGEAFFVQQSEENEGNIPSCLCTSPIPLEESPDHTAGSSQEPGVSKLSLSGETETSTSNMTLRKKRRRKKKPKQKEAADSTPEEQEGTESERSLEEKHKQLTPSESVYFSFTDLPEEEIGPSLSKEIYPYSDGELASLESLSPSHPASPKSDSELEIKPTEPSPLGAESHMQWTWGRLPQVSKSERVEPVKSTAFVTTTATVATTTPIPVGETTHFLAITAGLEGDLVTVDSQGMPGSCTTPVIRPTPVFQNGNGLPMLKDFHPVTESADTAESSLEASPTLAEEQGAKQQPEAGAAEEGGEETLEATTEQVLQLDPSGVQEAPAMRPTKLESTQPGDNLETKLENQRRQGSTKRSHHLGPSDIYLDDLTNLDEDQVALYFPKSDMELSPKPLTDPGSLCSTQLPAGTVIDSGTENLSDSTYEGMSPVALSLCGGLGDNREISHEKFMEHIISYQEFAKNPGVLDDPNLVILIHKKYYNWAVAAPMILSLQAFQKNIPKSTVDQLMKEKMPKKSGRWWFSWRRREFPSKEHEPSAEHASTEALQQGSTPQRQTEEPSSSDEEPASPGTVLITDATAQKYLPTYKKSLRLSSDQIKRLNLRDGPNEVMFSITTQYQGTCRCEATIYLWKWDDKVVISDIDGTITKSDALGHILPHLGKDWTHHGITKLYHKIHLNGYKFLYCSARAIGMAHITKGYLKWVNDQGCALPKGPILLAPSSLFSALHREVIEKKPEVFKIACLTDIRNLFGSAQQPFHAAFGNRVNDVYAYKQVGLPESRIFTVNPKGELIQELTKNHKSTYERLTELVELIFPPVGQKGSFALSWPEYSHFAYWRSPLPAIDLEDFS
ncbi:phosphatidate phosphatase LPIN3 isoform X1 [Alligator sinensis]|uniref:phosphatidate phosphatase n=2 Tax=Alligator sinensis TaxID=38654 RepID=A0A3Q0FLI1_ALLSI|nr:phosphatidate phosphatase LPIN3 isoform X1 [Alligator sinensis]